MTTTTTITSTSVLCVSAEWDPDGMIPYTSPAAFLRACETIFGEAPTLAERDDGEWVDADGDVVLVPEWELRAILHATWTVADVRGGGIWWPDAATSAEIAEAADPAARAVKICDADPSRGRWAEADGAEWAS